ncbi:thiol-disulfide oxidoreductase DCC family protein [Flavobacterium sp. W1B]|uniref:thiol-disulfide oxidoreductase DCC family protein n=1 Tax=Flavobacterium sp. W1B TaxID=3394146 RepID=UPI0039BD4545
MLDFPKDKKIILFDGICNLCDSAVQLIIKQDKKDLFRFVSLQSELGQEILKHIGIDSENIDSIVLYEPGISYYYKSEAVLEIATDLGSFYSLLAFFKILPTGFLNFIYDHIAKNRYQWYGKKEQCMIPAAELKSKFL